MPNLPEQFAKHLKSLNLSPATVYNYLSDLRRFFGWFQQRYKRRFKPNQNISEYINRYQKELAQTDIPPNTVARYLTSLNRYSDWLHENGHIESVVVIDGTSVKNIRKFAPTLLITISTIIIMLGSTVAALNYFGQPLLKSIKNRVFNEPADNSRKQLLAKLPGAGKVLADVSEDEYLEFNTDVRLTDVLFVEKEATFSANITAPNII